nr:hypothetical protein CFP56_32396 [Quercus suber]
MGQRLKVYENVCIGQFATPTVQIPTQLLASAPVPGREAISTTAFVAYGQSQKGCTSLKPSQTLRVQGKLEVGGRKWRSDTNMLFATV